MKFPAAVTPIRLAAATLCLGLAGCSVFDGMFSEDKVDYRNNTAKSRPLEVPPDLTQLARESRYQTQGGVISASGMAAAPAAAGAAPAAAAVAAPTVALQSQAGMRIERDAQQRWLVLPAPPEDLWPKLQAFWASRGFTIESADPKAGVMETNWLENRVKLPVGTVRSVIDRVFGNLYDTGERDRYRTRIERGPTGTEVYISHRGAEEIYADERRETTTWRGRPSDPQLEAEMLSRLMATLAGTEEPVAPARAAVLAAPEQPARARALAGPAAALEVDDSFDRAWRRVGLALDRSGFSVEDRDRAAGVYFVRYVDPRSAGKEEPGFWSRLFGASNTQVAVRYRIAVTGSGDKTQVAVLSSAGAPDTGDNGRRIVAQLVNELR